jgi:poly-gamma-glutamate synthesis protein (capsule biosynthesis protein)
MWTGQTASILAKPSAGRPPFTILLISDAVVAGLARYFGTAPGPLVHVVPLDEVKAAVRSPSALGLIRADDVTPDVRALALDGDSLFGSERISAGRSWRLTVASTTPSLVSTDGLWTLAAGGDVNLDRMVYLRAVAQGRGADFPWSAGTARLAHYECCGWDGAALGVARSTGDSDTLRSRFLDADLALVNFEGSAPNDYSYRSNSLTFTFDPALLGGLRDAGIDMVSLANNHIRNGGDQGVLDTCSNLDNAGIGHVGAGTDLAAARRPGWLTAAHLNVAVLAYSAVGAGNWATASHPGAAPLRTDQVTADIRAARASGADVVIVMPHWGQEYSYYVSATQKSQAAAFVAAGADLVLGSHSHWVGAIESLPGPNGTGFVDYSMGDLLFDLNHDVQSQEGEVVTLSFVGKRLAQVQIDPTIMIDGAQVGLLDPSGDGRFVLDAIRLASHGLLDW